MKAALPAVGMVYLVLPIDLVPDFIVGVGQIDDLSIMGIALFASTKILPWIAPPELVEEHVNHLRSGTRRRRHQAADYIEAAYTVVEEDADSTSRMRMDSNRRNVA